MKLSQLATQIGARLVGTSSDLSIVGIATLKTAKENEVSFFTNHLYRNDLVKTHAAAIIIADKDSHYCTSPMLIMSNPYVGYAKAVNLLNPPKPIEIGIHPTAWLSPTAQVDARVSIGAHAVIEADTVIHQDVSIGAGCVIGKNVAIDEGCRLMANVTICADSQLGKRVLIHPGAVIGADGFGLANDNGVWIKIPQLGCVVIGDDVEIGANTTIDRGALENTVINQGVKLDNQVQIAHNVHIGEHTAIAGCVGIAGSTRIGRYCTIAGGVGIVGHIELVDHVHVTGGSIVLQSILTPGVYSSGTPLQTNTRWRRNYHRFKQLDEIAKHLQTLAHTIK